MARLLLSAGTPGPRGLRRPPASFFPRGRAAGAQGAAVLPTVRPLPCSAFCARPTSPAAAWSGAGPPGPEPPRSVYAAAPRARGRRRARTQQRPYRNPRVRAQGACELRAVSRTDGDVWGTGFSKPSAVSRELETWFCAELQGAARAVAGLPGSQERRERRRGGRPGVSLGPPPPPRGRVGSAGSQAPGGNPARALQRLGPA